MTIKEPCLRKSVLWLRRSFCGISLALLAGAAACWLGTGCSAPQIEDKNGRLNDSFALPALLDGPIATILTNVNGFDSRVEITTGGEKMTAIVLGRDNLLLFANERGIKHPSKRRPGEQTFFIWDVSTRKGWVVNEPLQGYAPIDSKLSVTNLTITDLDGVFQTIDGHRCKQATVQADVDGQGSSELSIWRAGDMKNFPLLIKANNGQLVARFLEVHLQKPGIGMFRPPASYTQHANAELMLGDLVERLVRSKLRPSSEWNDTHPENPTGPPGQIPQRVH